MATASNVLLHAVFLYELEFPIWTTGSRIISASYPRYNEFGWAFGFQPRPPRICRTCGAPLKRGQNHCGTCAIPVSKERFIDVARRGREASHTPEAEGRRGETQSRQAAARLNWRASDQPAWLDEKTYREKIQPRFGEITVPIISSALGVSKPYATDIRAGRRIPHPRHWLALAQLVGMPSER
jgi:hypothetical protein